MMSSREIVYTMEGDLMLLFVPEMNDIIHFFYAGRKDKVQRNTSFSGKRKNN